MDWKNEHGLRHNFAHHVVCAVICSNSGWMWFHRGAVFVTWFLAYTVNNGVHAPRVDKESVFETAYPGGNMQYYRRG